MITSVTSRLKTIRVLLEQRLGLAADSAHRRPDSRPARESCASAAGRASSSSTTSTVSVPAAALGRRPRSGLSRRRRPSARGKYTLKVAPLARLAVDPDVAAALLDDAVDGGEPEPGALALFLGREERLEQPLLRLVVHADPAVADRQHHVRTRLNRHVLS